MQRIVWYMPGTYGKIDNFSPLMSPLFTHQVFHPADFLQ